MILEHLRLRREVSLLAAGTPSEGRRERVEAHILRCTRCRRDYEALRALVADLAGDPVRQAEPGIPFEALVTRVHARLDERRDAPADTWRAPMPRLGRLPVAVPALVVLLALVASAPDLLLERGEVVRTALAPSAASEPFVSEQALTRIERAVAREQAARYLTQAGDVLVAVAARGPDCDPKEARLDVGRAPARSRELLERRRLLVEEGSTAVASARGVLDDVELALREVAVLPSCVRRRDLERLRQQVEDRRLLMRIRLMTRELEG